MFLKRVHFFNAKLFQDGFGFGTQANFTNDRQREHLGQRLLKQKGLCLDQLFVTFIWLLTLTPYTHGNNLLQSEKNRQNIGAQDLDENFS